MGIIISLLKHVTAAASVAVAAIKSSQCSS
jgi:hypothetical protein